MSDAWERLNDEAEKRTGELSAREYHEKYKPGRDCDPAPIEEVSFEEEMEWEEIGRRREELIAEENRRNHAELQADIENERAQRLLNISRDILKDGGMPEGQATHFAWKIVKAFTDDRRESPAEGWMEKGQ